MYLSSQLALLITDSPKEFLGEKVFSRLSSFLRGYYDRRMALGASAEYDLDISLYGLSHWMADRHPLSSSFTILEVIELYAESDDEAFARLAEVLRDYLKTERETSVNTFEPPQERRMEVNRTDLFALLEKRAWICGGAHIQRFRSYLDGDSFAIKEVCGAQTSITPCLHEFESWLAKTYSLGRRCDWTKVMLLLSNGDPVSAYERFFHLLPLSLRSDDED